MKNDNNNRREKMHTHTHVTCMHYNRPPKTQKSLSLGEVTHWFNQTHTYIHDEKKKKDL